jgi:hypothetical protein
VSSKTTTRTTADHDTSVWDPTQRHVGGCIDQRTAGTGFGVIGRAVRVGLTLFGYKRWGREQRHCGTDDDEPGCWRGRGGLGGMGPGGGVEEDAAVVRQWRQEGESAYHNAPVAVAGDKKMLDAIQSIATGRPRPGHTAWAPVRTAWNEGVGGA